MVSFNVRLSIMILREHLRLMELNYKDTPYFNDYYQDLENIISREYKSLTELSTDLIRTFDQTKYQNHSCTKSKRDERSDKIFSIRKWTGCKDYHCMKKILER